MIGSKKRRLHNKFWKFAFDHFKQFFFIYIVALIALYFLHYFQTKIPLMAKELGDFAQESKLGDVELWPFFGVAIAVLVFRTTSRLLFFLPARYQQLYLRDEMVEILESTHPNRYSDFSEGQVYQIIFNDLNRIRGLFGFGFLQLGNIAIAMYVMIPKINQFEPKLLMAYSPLLLGVIVFGVISVFFQPWNKKTMDAQGDVQNFIMEVYEGKFTIKNYHSEKSFIQNFADASGKELKYFFISTIGPTLSIPLIRLSFGISLLWGAYLVHSLNLGASALIFFSGFLFLILEPLAFLSWIGVIIVSSYSAWVRIKEFVNATTIQSSLEVETSKIQKDNKQFVVPFWGEHLNISIEEKKWTVLIGETGCGKTHVLKNIADIYKLRNENISMVAQEPYLYDDSIEKNIFLGAQVTPELKQRALNLLKLFGLDLLAASDEELLSLQVGENGKKVSGGQAKRICLVRSLLSESKFIIWDDPFSSIDVILEKEILEKIRKSQLLDGRTIILSSHRLSTVKNANEIIYLAKDRGIIEQGDLVSLIGTGSKVDEFFKEQNLQ